MPPLKRAKHEQFAQKLIEAPSQVQAYREVFGSGNRFSASRLATSENVKQRFMELLADAQADLPQIRNRFAHWLNSDKHPAQSMDAVKTGLRIYGIIDAEAQAQVPQAITINVLTLQAEHES